MSGSFSSRDFREGQAGEGGGQLPHSPCFPACRCRLLLPRHDGCALPLQLGEQACAVRSAVQQMC